MGMTLVEKIFARHAGFNAVKPHQILTVDVDYCMANDGTMRLNSSLIEGRMQLVKLWDPSKVVIVMDHQVPADTPQAAEVHKISRQFAQKYQIDAFHDSDGICHQILLEKYVLPGQLVVGADSHTLSTGAIGAAGLGMGSTDISAVMSTGKTWVKVPASVKVVLNGELQRGVYPKDIILALIKQIKVNGLGYKAAEFTGPALMDMSTADRFTLCNMTAEAGAKTALIAPDEAIYLYLDTLRQNTVPRADWLFSDEDAVYEQVININLDELVPQVACPHSVDNVHDVATMRDTKVNQVFIGSCTNGRYEDLKVAADILRGRRIHPDIKLLITPASRQVYLRAMRDGLVEVFLTSGAVVNHPGCSTCWGAGQGVVSAGEVLLSTQNRNFKGRSGSSEALIYLASPATAAHSALTGVITDPRCEYAY